MGYSNFKPTVWSKHILRELERECQLFDFCWKQYEGEAKMGEKVKILGVGTPTIGSYTGASIGAPETVADQSTYLSIDQYKYFNFAVDDVDKAQPTERKTDKVFIRHAELSSETGIPLETEEADTLLTNPQVEEIADKLAFAEELIAAAMEDLT